MTTPPLPAGRHGPNRASWFTLAIAILVGVYNSALLVGPLLPPGDGWLYAEPSTGAVGC